MKLILLVSFITLFNFSSEVFCQETSLKSTELRPSKIETSNEFNPHKRVYLYETNKLLKFFKSGTIPTDFPKATSFISIEDYKKAIKGYASLNYDLFNHQELAKKNIVVKKQSKPGYNSEMELRNSRLGSYNNDPDHINKSK